MKFKEKLTKFWEGSFDKLDGLWLYIMLSLAVGGVFTIMLITSFAISSYNAFWALPLIWFLTFGFMFSFGEVSCGCC